VINPAQTFKGVAVTTPLFSPGRILSTPGALDALTTTGESAATFLARHFAGDWGDLSAEDRQANDEALKDGFRLLSNYQLADHTRIWIITEALGDDGERAATTVLLPSEY
jgi:hypothetical protein